ncbi:hypothetical protein [Amycolatopsis sp. H20-H5]|uniref:hypothetical protein n=1 Tax=Amycolatopsis sp. H20-H5 TaxID=3046309 RepID=UPI002DBC670E|nr:hypothetical protein [Amycolatopsis sp. H20-H5]MEC3976612.1 hypothetical protein [Amycolatopsis sp. H20-H5]
MPSARQIRQQLLQAEASRLKAREEAVLAVVGAAGQWQKAVGKAAEAERRLHAVVAAATQHVSAEELAEFGALPVKDVKNWARSGASLPTNGAAPASPAKPVGVAVRRQPPPSAAKS